MRILIAEDDLTSRLLLSGVLQKKGHATQETINGVEAWQTLQRPDAPRLVILDWMMPHMDGIELLRRIRAQTDEPQPYVLMLTAKGAEADIIAGLEAGADDYLVKPFDNGELLARVEVGRRMVELQDRLSNQMQALRASERKHRLLLEKSPDAIFSSTMDGRFEYVNQAFASMVGHQVEHILEVSLNDIIPANALAQLTSFQYAAWQSGKEQVVELALHQEDHERCSLTTITPVYDTEGAVASTLCTAKDITERKRLECYREMGREVLQILNEPGSLDSSLQRCMSILKTRTGFDAVGIRLQKEDDFPYIAQQGFPPDFLLSENTLLGHSRDGGICRDEHGTIRLECTCGLVLCGKTDPTNPLFTPGGSFWSNDILTLLTLPVAEEHRFHPRNQCIHHRFASMALVPIRASKQIVGLLQFNDCRRHRFTAASLETLEGIASHIGAALMRKQAEEALLEKQQHLSSIIDFLPDATFAIEGTGRIIIWNRAMEQMTGLSSEDMLNRDLYAYSIPFYGSARPQLIDCIFSDGQTLATLYPEAVREGDTLTTEVLCPGLYEQQGAWVFAKASPLRDRNGTIVGAIESIRDITYKKQMEEKLNTNIAWFKALFNATSDSVILIKPDGEILDLNNHAALRRKIDAETMRGQNLFGFLPKEAAHLRSRAIEQILEHRSLVQYDEARRDKHYRVRLFPILNDLGQVVQIASFSRDITESHQVEVEKKRLGMQLMQTQKMEALGTLAGGIAHDFNNILGAIIGYTEMARHACPDDSPMARHLDKVLYAGERATNLVRQILMFSRKNEVDRIALMPAQIIKEAIQLLRPSIPSTICFDKRITATQPVLADPTQLQQILMNLCVNAYHAMEQNGGVLEISLEDCLLTAGDLQRYPNIPPGLFVRLSVRDTGPGIPPNILDKIFDPYFTTKAMNKGSGMGLAIVQGIVASYGGFITCESSVGIGTLFQVVLPAHDSKDLPVKPPPRSIPRGQERILFIDDERMIADLGRIMLQHLGYQAQSITDSQEGLALFSAQPHAFDLIITDQTMPNLTGLSLVEAIRKIRPDIPVILCTGYSNLISEKQAPDFGIQGFAYKPLNIKILAELVRHVLDQQSEKQCRSEEACGPQPQTEAIRLA